MSRTQNCEEVLLADRGLHKVRTDSNSTLMMIQSYPDVMNLWIYFMCYIVLILSFIKHSPCQGFRWTGGIDRQRGR